MKGFRKGKAPLPLLKKMFGQVGCGRSRSGNSRSSVAEHLQEQRAPPRSAAGHQDRERELRRRRRPERQPLVRMPAGSARGRLQRHHSWNAKRSKLTKHPSNEAMGRLARERRRLFSGGTRSSGQRPDHHRLPRKIDDEAFEGGEAEDYPLVLGSNSFIPGSKTNWSAPRLVTKRMSKSASRMTMAHRILAGKAAVLK